MEKCRHCQQLGGAAVTVGTACVRREELGERKIGFPGEIQEAAGAEQPQPFNREMNDAESD